MADLLQILCALAMASLSSYLGGRVHQWRLQDDDRRCAFRAGFLRATTLMAERESAARQNPRPRLPAARIAEKSRKTRLDA